MNCLPVKEVAGLEYFRWISRVSERTTNFQHGTGHTFPSHKKADVQCKMSWPGRFVLHCGSGLPTFAWCRLGNERWLDALPWSNATEFQTAKEEIWVVNGTEAGSVRTASGLSFVKIADAVRQTRFCLPSSTSM